MLRTYDSALDEVEWILSHYLGPKHRAFLQVKALRDERIEPDEFARERAQQTALNQSTSESGT